MTLEEYAYVAEILGVIVVVSTLIYLAVQVRQGATLLRSEARQAQFTADVDLIKDWMKNPDLQKSIYQPGKLDWDSKMRLYYWLLAFSRVREHLWIQNRDGVLDQAAWNSYKSVIPLIFSTKRTREYWSTFSANFDPGYVAVVDGMLAEGAHIKWDGYWHEFEAMD